MSMVAVVGEVIVGRSSPAAVSSENVSASVQPLRRMNSTASRAPLPDTSASDPSGLKIRSRATEPSCSGGESSRIPSAPTPVCGAQIARMRPGVSANGSESASTIT